MLISWFALSGVFLSKFSGLIIVPMGIALLGIRLVNPAPLIVAFGRPREIRGRIAQIALFAAVMPALVLGVALSIWASFGFRYSLVNPVFGATTREVAWDHNKPPSRTVNAVVGFARQHRLLPEAYLFGLCHTLHRADQCAAFLNGEFRQRGWIYFFPYCLAVKSPLELFAVLALAIAALACFRGTSRIHEGSAAGRAAPYSTISRRLLVLIIVYWAFALTSHLNIGSRHLLPTDPAMMILAGAAAWWFKPCRDLRGAAESQQPALAVGQRTTLMPRRSRASCLSAQSWLRSSKVYGTGPIIWRISIYWPAARAMAIGISATARWIGARI